MGSKDTDESTPGSLSIGEGSHGKLSAAANTKRWTPVQRWLVCHMLDRRSYKSFQVRLRRADSVLVEWFKWFGASGAERNKVWTWRKETG